jgi:hypothetical protein
LSGAILDLTTPPYPVNNPSCASSVKPLTSFTFKDAIARSVAWDVQESDICATARHRAKPHQAK